jgi:hypothetical protein
VISMESNPAAPGGSGWREEGSHRGLGEGLRRLYAEYRRREAAALLSLIPPEAVRPLYRMARDRMASRGGRPPEDPVALLVDFVENELLPLPPFEVWLEDFRGHRGAHLQGLDTDPRAPDPEAPVTVEVRSFRRGDGEWYAGLSLFRRAPVWWGFLSFSRADGLPVARTADIFREEDPEAIRDRFRSFGPDALQAFLRSALP